MFEITGETRLLAVIGSPISHTLSPHIHNAFADAMGLNFTYMSFDVRPENIFGFIKAAKLLNMAGFSLTMPLKQDILPYIDVLDETAREMNAVNTVAVREGRLFGFNTDGEGFALSLENGGIRPKGLSAIILGTGGAAKAVAITLVKRGANVKMTSRRADSLAPVHHGIPYCRWDDLSAECEGCALIVNATPLGMSGVCGDFTDLSFLKSAPKAVVYDLIYAPKETGLLKTARETGHKSINGIPMLVYQAALAFERFTGQMPSKKIIDDVMRKINEL